MLMSMIFLKYMEELASAKLSAYTVKRDRGVKLRIILIIRTHRMMIRMTLIRKILMKLLQIFLEIKAKILITNLK
jgi:hypothetical protein